jgi:BioD-like phosphotransacetylase family protein
MPTALLIGSCEPFSGKSAVVLGLGRQLLRLGVGLSFGKPLASDADDDQLVQQPGDPLLDPDVRFVGSTLGLPESQLIPSLHTINADTAHGRLLAGDLAPGAGFEALKQRLQQGGDDLALLEAAGSLSEGQLYGLSLVQLARGLEAPVVLVHPWQDSRSVDALLAARSLLGDGLAGVVLNIVEPEQVSQLRQEVVPALERLGIVVFGVMPRSPMLRLGARVLCCSEQLNLLVETLSIGAMSVNSAMEFFRRLRNMAVITGADRTDIQLAALEASTQCLILTGVGEPLPQLLNRAEELEVPVLKVDHDTLSTVEVIEAAIGHVRLHEPVKATYAIRLVAEHCRFDALYERLKLPAPV